MPRRKAAEKAAASDDDGDYEDADAQPADDSDDYEQEVARKPAKRAKTAKAGPSSARPRSAGGAGASTSAAAAAGPSAAAPSPHPRQAAPGAVEINRAELAKMNKMIQDAEATYVEAEATVALGLSSLERDMLVGAVVRYMLFKNHEKPGVPVPRQQLVDLMTSSYKEHSKQRKLAQLIIPRAQYLLAKSFGLEMRELTRQSEAARHSAVVAAGGEDAAVAAASAPGSKSYVLHSALPRALRTAFVLDPEQAPQRGLALLVLTLIAKSGDKLDESALWGWLGQLGVQKDVLHPTFGKVTDELKRLEQIRYISISKRTGNQEPVYTAGEAAQAEFSVAEIDAFFNETLAKAERLRTAGRRGRATEEEVLEID